MSNRYVWGRFSADYEWDLVQNGEMLVGLSGYIATGYTINNNGKISLIDAIQYYSGASSGTHKYCANSVNRNDSIGMARSNDSWFNGGGAIATNGGFPIKMDATQVPTQGTLRGYTSAAASSAYPQDGVSGSYWYEYQGSDSIDARGCAIPSSIMGGSQIQISVTPSNTKEYGGTTSYIYQVKLGDGAWQTIQTTTAESINYTVPFGTTTFQARVQAKDDLGFTSTDYTTSSEVTVINNQPPTAPGSIDVANVVSGQTATITLTAATDPDGTIASYIYERSVDGQAWVQIANVNSLTQTDQVSADWGTVAYRACAVDDDGDSGPYVTSETTTVNSGWLIISGPAADMGDKPAPFNFEFSINATGATSAVTDIAVTVMLDGAQVYTGTPDAGETVSIPVDTRLMRAGEHTFQVSATKEDYLEVSGSFAFDVPAITLPNGGKAEQLQNANGDVIFPYTLARLVIGAGGKDMNALMEEALSTVSELSGEVTEVKAGALKMAVGTYNGTGTGGQNNPNSLTFDFAPMMVVIMCDHDSAPGPGDGLIWVGQNGYTGDIMFSISGNTLSWYSTVTNPDVRQLNNSAYTYYYLAIGQ